MPQNKSHHYVPQMYMRLFASEGDNRIGVFVIDRRKFVPRAPIRGQACRDYFYGKDGRTESALGNIEGHAARIFGEIARDLRLPAAFSRDRERLIFYIAMQHARTVGAVEQHNEGLEKVAKSILRTKAELEGNSGIVEALDRVRIRRTNAVSELMGYTAVGANLLADLKLVLIENGSAVPFIASDTPVVFHNRLYEGQHISVTGFANVALQFFLPLGPRLALFGFDGAAYEVATDAREVVQLDDLSDVMLINDLQWESAHAVILAEPDTPEHLLQASASAWAAPRKRERTVFREAVVEESDDQMRTRHGSGAAPSTVALDLSFVRCSLPLPEPLGTWEIPPFRDADRVARVDRMFEQMDILDELRGR